MAILDIIKYPDPDLRQVARPVKNITGDIVSLVQDMVETMYAAPGVGLAGPQVAQSMRIIVLDVNLEQPGKNLFKLINPEILCFDGEIVWEEGCLSVVDFTADVKRAARVEVLGLDEKEREVHIEAEGLLAVAIQHEIDHLDGKLFIDRISRLKRELYSRKLKKNLRLGRPNSEAPHIRI